MCPYTEQIAQSYNVCVPVTQTHTATRSVTKCVPVTTMKTVTKDMGSYQCQAVECPHDRRLRMPRNASIYKKVWVPNLVCEQVPCTTYQRQTCEVPYTYTTTSYTTETRTRMVNVQQCRTETRSRMCNVTKYRCETRTSSSCAVQRCRQEQRTRDYCVTKYRTRNPNSRSSRSTNSHGNSHLRGSCHDDDDAKPNSRLVPVTRTRMETRTRTVPYCEMTTETRTRMVNVQRCRQEQRTREYQVTKCRTETRTRMVPVTTMTTETRTRMVPVFGHVWKPVREWFRIRRARPRLGLARSTAPAWKRNSVAVEVNYTVCVPEQRTRTYNVTVYDNVSEQVPENYTVCVPVQSMRKFKFTFADRFRSRSRFPSALHLLRPV